MDFNSKNIDSVEFYLKKAETYNLNDFNKATLNNEWGKYYEEKKDYDKAILHYKHAEVLAKKINEMLILDNAYSGLYSIYQNIGNSEKAIDYSHKKMLLKDSILNKQARSTEITINDIVRKKEKLIHQQFSKSQKLYFILGVLVLLILSFLAIKIYKNQKDKKKALNLIEEKEQENHELKQKLNEAFEEVVKLAKENSPEFLTRFQEVYPDFYEKLINITPKLLNTELKLCAMLFLGFSTKDIAEYTFVTIKAAQHRKFRLRKKLSIPSDYDIIVWINENY